MSVGRELVLDLPASEQQVALADDLGVGRIAERLRAIDDSLLRPPRRGYA